MRRLTICAVMLWCGVALGQVNSPTNTAATSTPTSTSTPTPTYPGELSTLFGCYDGDGEATKVVSTGFAVAALFVAKKDAVSTHNIYFATDQMVDGFACQGVWTTGNDCQLTGYISALDATSFTADTGLNALGSTYCYYAFAKAWGALATGTYTGNGDALRLIEVGWQPDVVVLARSINDGGGDNAAFGTTESQAAVTPIACTLGSGSVQCAVNRQIGGFASTGFYAIKTSANLNGDGYIWIAMKKNAAVSRWLWTATWNGANKTPVAVNVGHKARMLMTSFQASGSTCSGIRHDQGSISTDPYLQRANQTDLDNGITLNDANGFSAQDECSASTGAYYAWGLFDPSHTPTITPTPTNTPTAVATNSCCDCGADINCVDPSTYGVGNECPAACTPIAQAACVEVP